MAGSRLTIPRDQDHAVLTVDGREVRLTNLRKIFWPGLGLTKGDLLPVLRDVADLLLPHLRDRAMVMKRYPDGAAGDFFFMKRAPVPRPAWIETCAITHGSGNVIDFPMIQDRAALLWVINLGCIDLEPVVRALRRRRSPRLPPLRSRSRRGRRLRPGPGDRAGRARRARRARDAVARQDHRIEGAPRLRADRARPAAEGRCGRLRRRWHRRWPRRHPALITAEYRVAKRPQRARARRLQPERLGPHAGVGLLGAPAPGGDRLDARSPGRRSSAGSASRTSGRQRSRAGRAPR